jgi:hypothetical protein
MQGVFRCREPNQLIPNFFLPEQVQHLFSCSGFIVIDAPRLRQRQGEIILALFFLSKPYLFILTQQPKSLLGIGAERTDTLIAYNHT